MNKLQKFFFQKINFRVAIIIITILVIFISAGSYWLLTLVYSSSELNKNGLPTEKQAIENRYAQERAEGLKNPATPNPNAPPPYPDVENPVPKEISGTKDWKTHYYAKYGISFKYPLEYKVRINKDDSIDILPQEVEAEIRMADLAGIDFVPINTEFYVSAGNSRLYYNQSTNHWILDGSPSCQNVNFLGTQSIPSYYVSDGRVGQGHSVELVVISQQGLLHFFAPIEATFPGEEPNFNDFLNTVMFDNPKLAIKASCD